MNSAGPGHTGVTVAPFKPCQATGAGQSRGGGSGGDPLSNDLDQHVVETGLPGHLEQHSCIARVKPDAASRGRASQFGDLVRTVDLPPGSSLAVM